MFEGNLEELLVLRLMDWTPEQGSMFSVLQQNVRRNASALCGFVGTLFSLTA